MPARAHSDVPFCAAGGRPSPKVRCGVLCVDQVREIGSDGVGCYELPGNLK